MMGHIHGYPSENWWVSIVVSLFDILFYFLFKGQHEKLQNLFFPHRCQYPIAIILLKKIGIWGISQIPRLLENFSDSEISKGIWGWYIFKILEIYQMTGYSTDSQAFGNSTDSQVFEEFSRFQDISRFLKESEGVLFFNYREPGNFPN